VLAKVSVRMFCSSSFRENVGRSELALRRAVLPSSISGGFQNTKSLPPCGAPSLSTTSNGKPVNSSASSRGLAIVAEHRMNCGARTVKLTDSAQPS